MGPGRGVALLLLQGAQGTSGRPECRPGCSFETVDPSPTGARRSCGGRDEARQRILAVVDSIPRGRVATYGQVADEAGLPRRARLVGRILAGLPVGSAIPWHRVVNAAGRISLRSSGAATQRRRLRGEGVLLSRGGGIDLGKCRWRPAD
jgi:methylated-DNA-protein-cysteine methyltransferase-like protein